MLKIGSRKNLSHAKIWLSKKLRVKKVVQRNILSQCKNLVQQKYNGERKALGQFKNLGQKKIKGQNLSSKSNISN